MAIFPPAVTILLEHEGGFAASDVTRGAVNFGITQQTAEELGLVPHVGRQQFIEQSDKATLAKILTRNGIATLSELTEAHVFNFEGFEWIRNLTKERAMGIYYAHWWSVYRLDLIESQELATAAFSYIVNMGPVKPVKTLQESLNQLGETLTADGVLGPKTFAALNRRIAASVGRIWQAKLASYYKMLILMHPIKYKGLLPGWLKRLDQLFAWSD